MSSVSEIAPASAAVALAHFSQRLALETDCADVEQALRQGEADFVLLHVVGQTHHFQQRHIPGAVHLPHRQITQQKMQQWPDDTLFVVYCAGPHCNGADRAAAKLAALGRPVKLMIGGLTGWADEGFDFAGDTTHSGAEQ